MAPCSISVSKPLVMTQMEFLEFTQPSEYRIVPGSTPTLVIMGSSLFCCTAIRPFKSLTTDHESKFKAFTTWAKGPDSDGCEKAGDLEGSPYCIQLVRQINYGPQEFVRYFSPLSYGPGFLEVSEDDAVQANFEKVNSYKNFRCDIHNRFFEVNLYQKNPKTSHHWRANLARPARDIDLSLRRESLEGVAIKPQTLPSAPPMMSLEEFLNDSPRMSTEETSTRSDKRSDDGLDKLNSILHLISSPSSEPRGKLIALVAFDALQVSVETAGIDVSVALGPLWNEHLNPSEIKNFVLDCDDTGAPVSASTQAVLLRAVSTTLPKMPTGRSNTITGRKYLTEVLQRMVQAQDLTDPLKQIVLRSMEIAGGKVSKGGDKMPYQDSMPIPEKPWSFLGDRTRYDFEEDSDYDRFSPYVSDCGRYSDESDKDLTACDKECGYCGHCQY